MKYTILIFIVLVVFSCKTSKTLVDVDNLQNQQVKLTDVQKRKFDYFFYEAQRFKVKGDLNKAQKYFVECIKIDSLSGASYYELANLALISQNYKACINFLNKSVRISPDNKWYKLFLADVYSRNKDYKSAITVYNKLNEQYPNNVNYIYSLSQLYLQLNDYPNAIKMYDLLSKQIGNSEAIHIQKEQIYVKMGKSKLAFNEINKLIKGNPKNSNYYGLKGDLYLHYKNYDKAFSTYNEGLKIDSNNGLLYFSLASLELEKKDTVNFFSYFLEGIKSSNVSVEDKTRHLVPFLSKNKQYKKWMKEIKNSFISFTQVNPDDFQSFYMLATFYMNNKEVDKSISNFKKALQIDNNNASIWQDLLLAQVQLNDVDGLYADGKEALSIVPNEPIFYLLYSNACMQKKLYSEAQKVLLKGLKLVPADNKDFHLRFYSALGDVEHGLNNNSKAYEYYDKALTLDENYVFVLNNYAYYLSIDDKHLDKAERMISKCVELEPGNSTYLDTYAWVLFKRKRYFEAKYIIESAISNGGDKSPVIVEHYGDILFMNGNVDEALVQWQKALDADAKNEKLKNKIKLKKYVP